MTIFKFDVDVRMNEDLLDRFTMTRLYILERLGYSPIGHKVILTENGYHCWFEVLETLSDTEACNVQFLLGDDQPRARFNYLRNEARVFKVFNALFNKKLKRHKR